jgi:hypothetical protein
VFLVVFVLGFAGVALYYSYKKGAWRRLPAYQYSVFHQFEQDPDDETGDPDQVGAHHSILSSTSLRRIRMTRLGIRIRYRCTPQYSVLHQFEQDLDDETGDPDQVHPFFQCRPR